MKDEATLAKCVRSTALTLAFQSEEPESIGPVAAAFAKFYHARGNKKEAQAVLHRAVEVVCPAEYGWHLPLEVARQGLSDDVPHARRLLETRTDNDFARACLSLFDAQVAQREGKLSAAHVHARDALEKFEVLHWYAYANEARSILPHVKGAPQPDRSQNLPFTDLQSVLTIREQQVAGFVLQGLTNHAIATELSITENTVEKHMTSIMNRLGIRSRYQLADAVGGNGALVIHAE